MKSNLKQYSYFTIHYIKASDNFFVRGSAEVGFWPVMSFPSMMTWACNYTILVNPLHLKIFDINAHLLVWDFLIDISQFLNFVLHKEGSILIVVINVRIWVWNFRCHSTSTSPAASSSVLENPVTFLPAKIDFPFIWAPMRAIRHADESYGWN